MKTPYSEIIREYKAAYELANGKPLVYRQLPGGRIELGEIKNTYGIRSELPAMTAHLLKRAKENATPQGNPFDGVITDEVVQQVVKELKVKGKHLDALAEAICDLKMQEACDVNNGGIEAQVRFLLEANGLKDGKQAIQEAIF